jgi:hypothetical protein
MALAAVVALAAFAALAAAVPLAAAVAPAADAPPGGPDAQGREATVTQEPPYDWIQGEGLRVGYRGPDSLRARRVLRFLQGLPPLAALPPAIPDDVRVYIAPDSAAFEELAGGTVPEWGAAVAVPSLGRMVIPREARRRTRGWTEARVLQHEWAHLGLHQVLQGLRVPRWFDEGYAEWASGGWNPTEGWRLRVAFALGRAPPLDSLVLDWPRDRGSAELAYLLSATAVEYLVRESGERGLQLFLEAWEESGSFPAALRRVYGVTPGQFEEDWKKYVRRRYGWPFVLSHSAVFWLALTLALLVMVRIRRGRNREGMARLRATEPSDRPAYWEGEDGGNGGTNDPPERSP